ncbi:TatD family hydrolase, partial [Patescibacteria group bacterium]|nr:TatD family hydrolase [Patescibacteria group bacterium]
MKPISDDVTSHWKKAQENGIEKTITVGADLETSKKALEIADKFPGIYASIGLHPEVCNDAIKELLAGDKYSQGEEGEWRSQRDWPGPLQNKRRCPGVKEKIDQFVDNSLHDLSEILLDTQTTEGNVETKSKLVAIGEIGLDYYRLKNKGLKRDLVVEMQKKIFNKQLELAFQNDLVAIIHVRDQSDRQKNNAYNDVLNILKKVIIKMKALNKAKFVLHCASGSLAYIQEAISLGAYIGIAGNVTYDNAQKLREIIKITPSNRLL